MGRERKPPRTGDESDYDPWAYPEVFAITVRHGADCTKRHYDRLYLAEGCGELDTDA